MEVISPAAMMKQSSVSQLTFEVRENRMNEMSQILQAHKEKRAKECEAVNKRLAFNCFFALTGTPAPRQEVSDSYGRYWTNERIQSWVKSREDESRKGLSSDSGISIADTSECGDRDVMVRGDEQCNKARPHLPPVSSRPLTRPVLCTFQHYRSASKSQIQRSLVSTGIDEGFQEEVVRLHVVEKNWTVSTHCSEYSPNDKDEPSTCPPRSKTGKFQAWR